jgi:hypothetical protein
MTLNESEVIIEIGADGGSVTLYGLRTKRGWLFSREVIDSGWALIGEGPTIQHKSTVVDSWEAALDLLDQYPWTTLYPISIHPHFRHKIQAAIHERLQNSTEAPQLNPADFDRALQNWREVNVRVDILPRSENKITFRGKMATDIQYGKPLIVGGFTDTAARGVVRIRFQKGDNEGVNYNEKWIQKLISRYPNVLPIEQIEPALTPAIPICMELPLASGFVDNLYATPDGDLIVGEAKLFRNPEARRAVVGQVMDYAKDLSALSYEKLEDAIKRAEAPDGDGGHPKDRLYDAVTKLVGHEEINEEQFIDAVSRNLKRGRFLLLVMPECISHLVWSSSLSSNCRGKWGATLFSLAFLRVL